MTNAFLNRLKSGDETAFKECVEIHKDKGDYSGVGHFVSF